MKMFILPMIFTASLQARAVDQVLACNFKKPKDQKYFTGSSRIDRKNPALKLNVVRSEMYPSKNLGTINGIDLKRIDTENFAIITGDAGQVRVKYMVPNDILGESIEGLILHVEVSWDGTQGNHSEWFPLNCDSRI